MLEAWIKRLLEVIIFLYTGLFGLHKILSFILLSTLAEGNYHPLSLGSFCDLSGYLIIMSPCVDGKSDSLFACNYRKFEMAPNWTLEKQECCLYPHSFTKIAVCLYREMMPRCNLGISRVRKKDFKEWQDKQKYGFQVEINLKGKNIPDAPSV